MRQNKLMLRTLEIRAEDNPKQLTEQLGEKKKRMQELLDSVKAENRAFSEAEDKEFSDLEKDIKAINATLEAEKRARDIMTENNEPDNKLTEKGDDKTEEKRAQEESDAFADYLRGKSVSELRANGLELTQGKNGDIVPRRISDRIISAVKDMCPFMQLSDVVVTNGEYSVPVYGEDDTNFINADYVDEGTDLTDNVGKFTTINLTGYTFGALALISNKLINNTDVDVTGFVVNRVAEALVEKTESEYINGVDKVKGILNATEGVTAASNAAITYDELVRMKHSLKRRFRSRAKWLMHPTTYTALCQLKDGTGQPYFKEEEYKILNLEVIESDSMPEIGAGAKPVALLDFSGYTIKATKNFEVQLLREKFATRNMLGILSFGEFDGVITDSKKVRVLTMPD